MLDTHTHTHTRTHAHKEEGKLPSWFCPNNLVK